MSNHNLDNLNSACCRLRGALLTLDGIQKGSFPEVLGNYQLVELAKTAEPFLKEILPVLLVELRALQAEAANTNHSCMNESKYE